MSHLEHAAALELERLKQLRTTQEEARALRVQQLEEARARQPRPPPPPGRPSPGLPRSSFASPNACVVQADLSELPRELCDTERGQLWQLRRKLEQRPPPVALAIAAVLLACRGLRAGKNGCPVQVPVRSWCLYTGRSERQVQYGFAWLKEHGWCARHDRHVDHQWTDMQGRTWKRAEVHSVAYLLAPGVVAMQRFGQTRKSGRLHLIGVVGKLLAFVARKLRAVAVRVSASKIVAPPPTERSASKASKPERGRAKGAPPTGPPGHVAIGRQELTRDAERCRGGPQGEGAPRTAEEAWPDLWRRSDARGRQWLHELFVRGEARGPSASAKQRAAQREWVRRRAAAAREGRRRR